MADFPSMNHLALTVTDLDVSIDWYQRLFDVGLEFFAPPAA